MQKWNIFMYWFMNDWGEFGRTYEKLAESLSSRSEISRVICLLPPIRVSSIYTWPLKVKRVTESLYVIEPRIGMASRRSVAPHIRSWFGKKFPEFSLRILLRCLGFSKASTILWIFPPHPYINSVIRTIPHDYRIVQIIDNNVLRERVDQNRLNFERTQYEELVKESDLVFTSSEANFEIFSALNRNCFFYDNAVDPIFLKRASELPYKLHSARPRIGYVGWFTERTDLRLIDFCARQRPEYEFVLAGPQDSIDINEYGTLELPNVKWLGYIPYGEVAELIDSFDVCLIPHKDTPYSASMNPLKLYQYLGSGRPIVSMCVAGVGRWKNLIEVATTHEEFVGKIDKTLRDDSKAKSHRRVSAAYRETWRVRTGDMFKVVLQNVAEKNARSLSGQAE